MPDRRYVAKEIIFREGDPANTAFILREGEVEILKHSPQGEIILATLSTAGEVLGEMSLFESDGVRSATARAKEAVSLDILDKNEFEELVQQCPERILPIVRAILGRLRDSNERISQKEQGTILLDSEIENIRIESASDACDFEGFDVTLPRLPFAIGGYDEQGGKNAKNRQNQFNLPCEGPPLVISRRHCQIEIKEEGLYLVDLGSRFNTIINGKEIGRGRGDYSAPLQKGENLVIMGGRDSPYKITITCS
jgi:hypothetical protein